MQHASRLCCSPLLSCSFSINRVVFPFYQAFHKSDNLLRHFRLGKSEEKVLYMQKHRVTAGKPVFEIVVDEKPLRAGIDPYNKLVDRNSNDNVKRVKKVQLIPDYDLINPVSDMPASRNLKMYRTL